MLIQMILTPIWAIINGLISLLGGFFGEFTWSVGNFDVLLDLLGYGVYFFGATTFCMVVSNISFWLTVDMVWVIVEWIYKKIPGIS